MIHKIMAHLSSEVVQQVKNAVKGLKIDKKSAGPPNSIECVIYAISKSTQIISQYSKNKEAIEMCSEESWS